MALGTLDPSQKNRQPGQHRPYENQQNDTYRPGRRLSDAGQEQWDDMMQHYDDPAEQHDVDEDGEQFADRDTYRDTNEDFNEDYNKEPDEEPGDKKSKRDKEGDDDSLADKESDPEEAPGNDDDVASKEKAASSNPGEMNYQKDDDEKGGGRKGPRTPGLSPLKLWHAYKKRGITGVILVIATFFLLQIALPSLPRFQLDFSTKAIRKLSQKLKKRAADARERRYLESYTERVLMDDVKACGSLDNKQCLKDRADARMKDPNYPWPKGKRGKMFKAWNDSIAKADIDQDTNSFTDILRRSGVKMEAEGGNVKITAPDGTEHTLTDGNKGQRWPKGLSRSVQVEYSKRAFSQYFLDRNTAKVAMKKWGARLCSFFCDPEDTKKATKADAKKTDEERQKEQNQKYRNVRDSDFFNRLIEPFRIGIEKFLVDCILGEKDCSKEDDARKFRDEYETDVRNKVAEGAKSASEKEKEGAEINADEDGDGVRDSDNPEPNDDGDSVDRQNKFVTAIEKQLAKRFGTAGVPYLGWAITLAKLHGFNLQIALILYAEDNNSMKIIRNSFIKVQGLQAANMLNTAASEVNSVKDKDFEVEAAIAMIGAGGPIADYAQSKLFQQTEGSAYNSPTPETAVIPYQQRMDKDIPPREANKGYQIPGEVIVALNWINPNSWVFLGINEFLDAADIILDPILELIAKAAGALNPLQGLLDQLNQKAFDWIVSVVDNMIQWILGIYAIDFETVGGRLWDFAHLGEDYMNYSVAQGDMGGRELTEAETLAVLQEAAKDERVALEQSPLSERLFSTENPQSLFGRILLASPVADATTPQNVLAAINPFKLFAASIRSLSPAHAGADDFQMSSKRFGIPNAGFPLEDPCIEADPWADMPEVPPEDTRQKDAEEDDDLNIIAEGKVEETNCDQLDNFMTDVSGGMTSEQPVIQ